MAGADKADRDWLHEQSAAVAGHHRLAVVAGLAQGPVLVAQAAAIAWLVARLVAGEPVSLAAVGAVLLAAIVARGALQATAQWAGSRAGQRVVERVRTQLLDHLAALGPARLAEENSGSVASRVVEQVDALEGYYARFRPQMAVAMGVPLVILPTVFWLDWLAGALLLAAAPLIPLFMALVGMGAEQVNRRQFQALSYLAGHFLDRVRLLPTLQLFGHAERSIEEVAGAADEYRRRSMRTLRVAFLSSAVLEFFASVAIATVAIYIGFALLGYIDFGPAPSVTAFSGLLILLLAPEFFQPLRTLSQHYHDRAAALGAAGELRELLTREVVEARVMDQQLAPGRIEAAGVVVEDAERGRLVGPHTLSVGSGECLVLWGPSGSGKSTLLRVVAGLQAPTQGSVRVGGEGGVGWVGQRPFLIAGTIADNIRLGSPAPVGEAELQAAARASGVAAFSDDMPDGLDTQLGERGQGLSGGQAQRVALARVFLSDAAVVVLDEPTGSLDGPSAEPVLAALSRLRESGRTLIMATHHEPLRALGTGVLALATDSGSEGIARGG